MMTRVIPRHLALAALLVPVVVLAEDESAFTSRLTFSPRVALNVSARFEGLGSNLTGGSPRTTPDGDAYNYDNGYVLTDVSGNAGGQTWYWGYDNSAQVSGNTIVMSSSTVSGDPVGLWQAADPSPGAELVYSLQLGSKKRLRHGIEVAASYQDVRAKASASFPVTLITLSDAYSFTSGSTPPSAPYQGTYSGPGFMIGSTPSSSSSTTTPGVNLASENELQSTLWGFRLGPYFEYALSDRVAISLSGGVVAGVLDAQVSWSESAASSSASGSASDLGVLMGFYASGTVSWQFAECWSLLGGIQYQNLGTYEHSFNDRLVQLEMNNTFFASVGIGWSF